jgi:hypothetical protein
VPYGAVQIKSPLYKSWKAHTDSKNSLSLFLEKVPDARDCEDVSIPLHYCACKEFTDIPLLEAQQMPAISTLIQVLSTQLGIHYINSMIKDDGAEDICMLLSYKALLKASVQILTTEEWKFSRNFKVRISVNENEKVKLDIIGLMVSTEESDRLRSGTLIANTTFEIENGDKIHALIQVKSI